METAKRNENVLIKTQGEELFMLEAIRIRKTAGKMQKLWETAEKLILVMHIFCWSGRSNSNSNSTQEISPPRSLIYIARLMDVLSCNSDFFQENMISVILEQADSKKKMIKI